MAFAAKVRAWTLEEALERRQLRPLFGNVDLEARRKYTRSSFDTIIEIRDRGRFVVCEDANEILEEYLADKTPDGLTIPTPQTK